jgi:hypothetical protein
VNTLNIIYELGHSGIEKRFYFHMAYLSYAVFPKKFPAFPSKWLIHSITTSLEQHELLDSTDKPKGNILKCNEYQQLNNKCAHTC